METIKCRTCLTFAYTQDCTSIDETCLGLSIKEVLLRLVPEMDLTVQNGNVVCKRCLETLKTIMKFIKTCLTVETILNTSKDIKEEIPEVNSEGEEIEIFLNQVDFDHNYYVKQAFTETVANNKDLNGEASRNLAEQVGIDSPSLDNDAAVNNLGSPLKIENPSLNSQSDLEGEDTLNQHSDLEEDIKSEGCSVSVGLPSDFEELESDDMNEDGHDFTCSICSAMFLDKEEFELHKATHFFLCHFCGQVFSYENKNKYRSHLGQHYKHQLLKVCEYCGLVLKGHQGLRSHIMSVHKVNWHPCDKCNKSYKTKYKLDLHVKEVHERAKQQQCPVCNKIFVNREKCRVHHKLVHLKVRPFSCTICGESFGRKDYLEKHKVSHGIPLSIKTRKRIEEEKRKREKARKLPRHGISLRDPGTPVVCRVCGKQLVSVHILKAHLESHVKINRHKCKYCELTFTMAGNRKRHEKLHESYDDNKFRCNICWKRVKTKEELDRHVNNHDRPPQYQCETCGEKFHRNYLLQNHITEKHTSPEEIEQALEEIVKKNLLEFENPNA